MTRALSVVGITGAALLALGGCATAPPQAPDVEKVLVPIEVTPKRELPQAPRFAVEDLPLGAPLHEQAQMCYAEREQRRAYEIELVGACK